jgi:hypothetical protein
MNLAFFTFNAVLLIGLIAYERDLARKAKALESVRQSVAHARDMVAEEWQRLILAAECVDRHAAMFGPDEVPDPGDVDPSQRRWMVN